MILIDTNVLSELLRPAPSQAVVDWMVRQTPSSLYIATLTLAEVLAGLAFLPDGKRKSNLTLAFNSNIRPRFESRIVAFDERAAEHYAVIEAAMRKSGRAISAFDCQIAAIAAAHGLSVATRDVQPFRDAGVDVINPWTA